MIERKLIDLDKNLHSILEMVKEPKEFGIDIYGYDSMLSREEIKGLGINGLDDFNVKVDCVIVAVVHDEFKKMKLEDVSKFMNNKPIIVDVRRMFEEEEARKKGFYYRRL